MKHYDDIDYDQFLHLHRDPAFQLDLHWTFLPSSEIAKQAAAPAQNPPRLPFSYLAIPTIRPPKTNSGPPSTKPSSIASPPTPNSTTLSSPPAAKVSQTTAAGEILSLTTKIWQNNPGDLVQTNHFPSQVRSGSPTP